MLGLSNLTGFNVEVETFDSTAPWLAWDGTNDGSDLTVGTHAGALNQVDMDFMDNEKALVVYSPSTTTLNVALLDITNAVVTIDQTTAIDPAGTTLQAIAITRLSGNIGVVTYQYLDGSFMNLDHQIITISGSSFTPGGAIRVETKILTNNPLSISTSGFDSTKYNMLETVTFSSASAKKSLIPVQGSFGQAGTTFNLDSSAGYGDVDFNSTNNYIIYAIGSGANQIFLEYAVDSPFNSGIDFATDSVENAIPTVSSIGVVFVNDQNRFIIAYSIPNTNTNNQGRAVEIYDEFVSPFVTVGQPSFVSSLNTDMPIDEIDGGYSVDKVVDNTFLVIAAQANGTGGGVTGRVYVDLGSSIQRGSIVDLTTGSGETQVAKTPTIVKSIDKTRALAVFLAASGTNLLARVLQV